MPEAAAAEPIPAGAVEMSKVPSVPEPAPSQGPLSESFTDLDKMLGGDEPESKQEATESPKSVAETADKKSDQKAAPGKEKTTKDTPSAKDAKETDGLTTENGKALPAPELRKAYQELKVKLKAIESERDQFRSQADKYKPDVEERTRLSERLAMEEKRRQAIEDELKMTAYERSAEFKERYYQPFVDAYELGREAASRFKAANPDGTVRQGTADDFDRIVQMVDDDEAAKLAEEMFGSTKAAVIMQHKAQVMGLAKAQHRALEQAKTMVGERDKLRMEQQLTRRKALGDKWDGLNKAAAEKYPDLFAPKDGDDKGNELLEQGYKLADLAFSGDPSLSEERLVEIHSAIRNRAAAFGRMHYELKNTRNELAEVKAKLAEYEKSEPKAGEGKRDKTADNGAGGGSLYDRAERELDSLATFAG